MYNPRQGGDPEVVIRQAMRAMAGGRRGEHGQRPAESVDRRPRLTGTQLLLLAAIIGLVLGMAGGFVALVAF